MGVRLVDSMPKRAVRADVAAKDWRSAVREAGNLLVATGAAGDEYVEAIIKAVDDLGPYIVLAPGIALAHARPEDGAKSVGFALARLREPVEFGSEANDPVDLVFAFASPDSNQHVAALSALADFIESGDNVERLRAAEDDDALYDAIEEAAS